MPGREFNGNIQALPGLPGLPAPSIQFPMLLVLMHCQQHLLRAESAIKGAHRGGIRIR